MITTCAPLELGAMFLYGKTDLDQIFARIINQLRALETNRAYQPLSNERCHHRGEQKRLHVHVEQTRDTAHGVVGVQRAEDKVTSHGCADGDVRGFDVANLTNHHHIRILSQNMAEPICETPGIRYSTGSSIVMMRRCTELMLLKKQYNEVDLPQPVGPVSRMIPFGCASRCRMISSCFSLRSSRSNPNCCSPRLSNRKLIDSPFTVGMVETRTSMFWLVDCKFMRPS